MPTSLDHYDLRLLDILQREGRISNAELAERLALSPSACLRRLRALEGAGLIVGYAAQLDAEALGYGIEAYVSVNLQLTQRLDPRERFHDLVRAWPEVVSAAIVTGETQYILHVRARDMKHYSEFVLERLYREARALDIRSNIILSKVKRHTVLDLPPPPRNPPARRKAQPPSSLSDSHHEPLRVALIS